MKHKNYTSGQSGFTILEVTLFLAISSLLILIALLGTGSSMESARFTDTIRTTQAFLQDEYAEVLNGVNPRPAAAICGAATNIDPGKSDCILIGKLVRIDPNNYELKSYYVVARAGTDLDDGSDTDQFQQIRPQVVTGDESQNLVKTFNIPWGAAISGTKRSDNTEANSYLVLRSLQSSRVLEYTFNMPAPIGGPVDISGFITDEALQKPTNFCIQSASLQDKQAALQVPSQQADTTVSVQFEVQYQDCHP